MADTFTIGRLAKAAGCKVQTVRYYEQIGLLARAQRSHGNQRIYSESDTTRLAFVRHARALGFSIEAVRDLLSLADEPDKPCAAVDAIAQAQLVQVVRHIGQLQALRAELERMIAECSHNRVGDCRILSVLGDHGACLTHDHGAEPERTAVS